MTTLAQITMNAGDDIPGSLLKSSLIGYHKHFDRVIVVDGNLTEAAKKFYKGFDNVVVIDSPWKDSYVDQYKAFSSELKDGEWCLYLDDDELPSDELLKFLKTNYKDYEEKIFALPCVLFILNEDLKYYPAEPAPANHYTGQWTKKILFEKRRELNFHHFGSHVIPYMTDKEPAYIPYPYFHMKSLESFVYNDVWQAFLHPGGQGYTEIESKIFKELTKQFKDTKQFKEVTENNKWPLPLQKFAYDHMKEYHRPISRLAWVYFILEGNFCIFGDVPSWDEVKNYVLSKQSNEIMSFNITKQNYWRF